MGPARLFLAAAAEAVGADGEQDDKADDNGLPVGRDAHKHEAVAQKPHQRRTGNDAGNGTASAGQRDAAENDGCDDVHFVAEPEIGVGIVEKAGDQQPAEAGERARQGEDADGQLVRVDAGITGGFQAVAHGVDVAAPARAGRDDPDDDRQKHQPDELGRNPEYAAATEKGRPIVELLRAGIGDQQVPSRAPPTWCRAW